MPVPVTLTLASLCLATLRRCGPRGSSRLQARMRSPVRALCTQAPAASAAPLRLADPSAPPRPAGSADSASRGSSASSTSPSTRTAHRTGPAPSAQKATVRRGSAIEQDGGDGEPADSSLSRSQSEITHSRSSVDWWQWRTAMVGNPQCDQWCGLGAYRRNRSAKRARPLGPVLFADFLCAAADEARNAGRLHAWDSPAD